MTPYRTPAYMAPEQSAPRWDRRQGWLLIICTALSLACALRVAEFAGDRARPIVVQYVVVEHAGPMVCSSGRIHVEWDGPRAIARCDTNGGPRAVVMRDEWECDPPGDVAHGLCQGIRVEYAGDGP